MTLSRFFPYPSETADYIWNVSLELSYAYLATPKAASTAILRVLQLAELGGDESRLPDIHERALSPLLSPSKLDLDTTEVFTGDRFFRFTYVRNPYTRILSTYLDKMVKNAWERERLLPELGIAPGSMPTFIEFLRAVAAQRDSWRDIHWQTQSRLVQRNSVQYHFIGRFENWQDTLPDVADRIGIAAPIETWIGKAPHATEAGSNFRQYFNQEARDLILRIYDADFWTFCYSPDLSLCTL